MRALWTIAKMRYKLVRVTGGRLKKSLKNATILQCQLWTKSAREPRLRAQLAGHLANGQRAVINRARLRLWIGLIWQSQSPYDFASPCTIPLYVVSFARISWEYKTYRIVWTITVKNYLKPLFEFCRVAWQHDSPHHTQVAHAVLCLWRDLLAAKHLHWCPHAWWWGPGDRAACTTILCVIIGISPGGRLPPCFE